MFTDNQIKEIRFKLAQMGMKDSSLPSASLPFVNNEEISFVQNGKNVKMRISDLFDNFLLNTAGDFVNISEKNNDQECTLTEAIALVPEKNKKIGIVITFIDSTTHEWIIYQFKGVDDTEWNNLEKWGSISIKDVKITSPNGNQTLVYDESVNMFINKLLTFSMISITEKLAPARIATDESNRFVTDSQIQDWTSHEPPVGGFANNLYFSEVPSSIHTGFKTLSYTPDINTTLYTVNVKASDGVKLVSTHLYTAPVAINLFPSGVWSFIFYGKTDSASGNTQIGVEYFKRSTNGTITTLFTVWSKNITNLIDDYIKFEVTNPTYPVDPTDVMGARIYVKTDHASARNLTFSIGDGYGAYLNNPNKIRHNQLRDLNGDSNFLHISDTEKSKYEEAYDYSQIGHMPLEGVAFTDVSVTSANIVLNYNPNTPYYEVVLGDAADIYNLRIDNMSNGQNGKLLIQQTSNKKLAFENLIGQFDLPISDNDYLLIDFFKKDNEIFGVGEQLLRDGGHKAPQKIEDLSITYYDSSVAELMWTAPHGSTLADVVTGYDVRYSNALVNAENPKVWLGLTKVPTEIVPQIPGTEHRYTLFTLKPNQEYYIYIKTFQIIYGNRYNSFPSNFAYCKTLGNDVTEERPYRLQLDAKQIHSSVDKVIKDGAGNPSSLDKILDEQYLNKFLETGYPDLLNKSYATYWLTDIYSRSTAYFKVIIDLYQVYNLDKIFMYSSSQGAFSVYSIPDIGLNPVLVTDHTIKGNNWATLNFNGQPTRFVVIQFDLQKFCFQSTAPVIADEAYGVPDPYYNSDLGRINNIIIYGKSVQNKPDLIKPVKARQVAKRTIDQVICTNGHAYHPGRIHSKVSGKNVRLYLHAGHFCAWNGSTLQKFNSVAEYKFTTSHIPWVYQNGNGMELKELLQKTYAKYGLKPFFCFTGTNDYVRLKWNNKTYTYSAPVDNYAFPAMFQPLPKNTSKGLDEYFGVTANALNYKIMAKLGYTLGATYGSVESPYGNDVIWDTAYNDETGLDLISGLEFENEPDKSWQGVLGYRHPEEAAALQSAICDGHNSRINDELQNNLTYGIKKADPNLLSILPGLVNNSSGYLIYSMMRSKAARTDFSLPFDTFNFHMYFSNQYLNDDKDSDLPTLYAVSPEETLNIENMSSKIRDSIELRDYYAKDKQVWLTEFGYGEGGRRNGKSKYQCYTMMGDVVNNITIPDRHRSDFKGAWTVRAILQLLKLGVDQMNTYVTMSDFNWFDTGQYGGGAGYEMFEWDKIADGNVGKKYVAIEPYEIPYDRTGFSAFGWFGSPLVNGAYPISRGYWYLATMRNRLKGYIYLGSLKHPESTELEIHCFRKPNEDKGAYVVYYNHPGNTGLANITLDLPAGNTEATVVKTYVPKITDPRTVPSNLGTTILRTGLPTARHEVYENGAWVIKNIKPDWINYESFAQGAATYPANPQEGDEVVVLPTAQENPYFPIVGPVGARYSAYTGALLGANQYDKQTVNGEGITVWSTDYLSKLSWRQAEAVCDYIDYSVEGQKGSNGIATTVQLVGGKLVMPIIDVIPQYIFFNGVPETSYESVVTDLSAATIDESSVQLWWNNSNVEDTAYDIFVSTLPETGYTLNKQVAFGTNTAIVSGLNSATTYYFKVRPVRNTDVGEFSNSISSKTSTALPNVTNFRLTSVTNNTANFAWDFTTEPVEDFFAFALYKDSGDGNFKPLIFIEDIAVRSYSDATLSPAKTYNYKMKVIGLGGQSEFTPEVNVITLSPEQSSPVLLSAQTDKLGTMIVLEFNIDLMLTSTDAKTAFVLTENGDQRLIKTLYVDSVNTKRLILEPYSDSLSTYDKHYPLKLSYNPTDPTLFKSTYGINVDGFTNKTVVNWIGNYINLIATYKINFTNPTYLAENEEWNNIFKVDFITNKITQPIKDSFGRELGVTLKYSGSDATERDSGRCIFTDIPENVKKIGFDAGIPNLKNSYTLGGLSVENKYKLLVYASRWRSKPDIEYSVCQMQVGEIFSNITDNKLTTGTNQYMSLDDVVPVNSEIDMKLFNPYQGINPIYNYQGAAVNFMIIEEYTSNEAPINTDVFIRSLSVQGDTEGTKIVYSRNINLLYNIIGVPTDYMISENEEFTGAVWTAITETLPITLSEGFGTKTVYVKFKNASGESNTKSIVLSYVDGYIPLELRNVFINNGDYDTNVSAVSLFVEKVGNPTHYKISKTFAGIDTAEWLDYSTVVNNTIPYTIDEIEGDNSIYLQLKDDRTTSDVKFDTIKFVLLTYTTHTLTVPLNSVASRDNINVEFAPVKYNKTFALSTTWDDTGVTTWNRAFAYFNQKWIDNLTGANYYHIQMTKGDGGYPSRPLTFTDGCGVKRRFSVNSANWYNLRKQYWTGPIGQPQADAGLSWPFITWLEQTEVNDFDGACALHDVHSPNVPAEPTGYTGGTVTEITDGVNDVQVNHALPNLGRKLQVMIEPNGDIAYTRAAEQIADIKAIAKQHNPNEGFNYVNITNNALNVEKMKFARIFQDSATLAQWQSSIVTNIVTPSINGVAMYADLGMHGLSGDVIDRPNFSNITQAVKIQMFDWLCDTYGEHGSDTMWFCTPDELIQFLTIKKRSILSWNIVGDNLVIDVQIPDIDNVYWKELTINVTGATPNGTLNVTNNTLEGLSFNNDTFIMININSDPTLVTRAEKYTALYETLQTAERKRDALYFIQRLRSDLQTAYLNRLGVFEQPPVLNNVVLDSGSGTTNDLSVTVAYSYSGSAPEEYIISENSDFSGTGWQSLPISNFQLTDVAGLHTVYFKVRNDSGESNVVSDIITYETIDTSLIINDVTINSGAATTENRNISVAVTYIYNDAIATEYRISESSDFTGSSWLEFTASPLSFMVSEAVGIKTVYVQLRNASSESNVLSDTIELIVAPETAVLSFREIAYNTIIYDTTYGYTVNLNRSNVAPSYTAKQLKSKAGVLLPWYHEVATSKYPINAQTSVEGASVTIGSGMNPTGLTGNTGPYPDEYLRLAQCLTTDAGNTKKSRVVFSLPNGHYKMKIISSTSSSATIAPADLQYVWFRVDISGALGTPVQAGPPGFTGLDNVNFNAEIDFDVYNNNGLNGGVVLYWYHTRPTQLYYKPQVNLIEINKIVTTPVATNYYGFLPLASVTYNLDTDKQACYNNTDTGTIYFYEGQYYTDNSVTTLAPYGLYLTVRGTDNYPAYPDSEFTQYLP